jgi:hypothetical protein
MPFWIATILGGLVQIAGHLVGRILISLGVGYVTFTGIDSSLTWAKDFAMSHLMGAPAVALSLMGLMKVGSIISMLVSAYGVRLLLNGLTGGTLSRMVTKPQTGA